MVSSHFCYFLRSPGKQCLAVASCGLGYTETFARSNQGSLMEGESQQDWEAEPRNCTSGQGLGPQEAVTILSCLSCVGLWSLARPQGLPTHLQSLRIPGPKNPCSAGRRGASTLPGPLPTPAQNFLQKEKAPGDETVKLHPSGSVPAQPRG